ncbi:MAG: hypothetical protein R3E58_08750 [Phycisphaerae bacterium]
MGDHVWQSRPLYRIKAIETKLVVYECEAHRSRSWIRSGPSGLTTLYTIGALAVLLLLGFGFRRREVALRWLAGAAQARLRNVEPLGMSSTGALPMSIF